jgi:hypothetical protein
MGTPNKNDNDGWRLMLWTVIGVVGWCAGIMLVAWVFGG